MVNWIVLRRNWSWLILINYTELLSFIFLIPVFLYIEQGVERNIWIKEGWSDRRVEKTAQLGAA
jgi:hypothetical protein